MKCVDWRFTISVPIAAHKAYNNVFKGNFLHTQVIRQLDDMFEKNPHYSDENDGYIIEFLFYCSVYKNREKGNVINLKCSVLEKYDKLFVSEISFLELLNLFQVNKKDIITFLEKFFFHPDYKECSDELMEELEQCHSSYVRDGRKEKEEVKRKRRNRKRTKEERLKKRNQTGLSIRIDEWKEEDGSIFLLLEKDNVAFLERTTKNGNSSTIRFKTNDF